MDKETRALAVKLGIAERVIFTGRLSNPYSLLQRCDCFVLSSDYEGQPVVLLEALTLKVPCIGTNIPAVQTVLADGRGVICEANAISLAEAMIEFANNPIVVPEFDVAQYNSEVMHEFYTAIGV